VTRGMTAESSSAASPTTCSCDLDSRDDRYAPRNPVSPLYGLIGRNTPFRWGYTVGSPWLAFPGTSGNRVTTPGSSTLAVGDLDVRLDAALDTWVGQSLAARYQSSGEHRAWAIDIAGTGQVGFYWSPDGSLVNRQVQFSTVPVPAYRGQRLTLRITLDVDNGRGGYELRFYTGRTVNDTEWVLLGAPIIGTSTTAVYDGPASIELGHMSGITTTPTAGRLHAFRLLNGIDGTTVASMTTADATPGATSFTSGGRVWTLAGATTLSNRHVRMAGEVPAWPPTRDLSGQDNYVSINPAGITRRMDAGNKPQDSAIRRYIKAEGALECWPLTDGVNSTTAKSLMGGRDMVQPYQAAAVAPSWAAGRLADWVEPVLAAKAETIGGLLGYAPYYPFTGADWSVDLFMSGGGRAASGQFIIYDTGAGTNASEMVYIQIIFTGNTNQLTIIRNSQASDSSSSSLLANVSDVNVFDDQPHHMRISVTENGTRWTLYIDGTQKTTGSIGVTMRPVSRLRLGWGYATIDGVTPSDRSFGYLTYWIGGPSAAEVWRAFMGFQGERAGDRIIRLATEAGYTATVAGEQAFQQPMGIQDQAKLLELLNEAARTDFGYLLDRRDAAEVIHRSGSTLWNQPPALVLDYESGVIGAPFRPVDDDKLTENDVSIRRRYGSVPGRQVLEEGELSVQDPPNGVGRYDTTYEYSLATDPQADQVAYMRLHLGTYNGVRYTRITLNLANERVAAMIDDILRIDCGDKIRLTNLPADHGPDAVDVLVHGYTEEAGPDAWKITFNCVPGEPWSTFVVDSFTAHIDTGGSTLNTAVNSTATTVSLAVPAGGRLWTSDPQDLPFDIRVGGEVMSVVAPAGLSSVNPFFTTDTDGWNGQNATLARVTDIVHPHPTAVASMRVTPAGGISSVDARTTLSATGTVQPGVAYIASAWVYAPNGWSDLRCVMDFYNAAGTFLSSGPSTAATVQAGQWTYLSTPVTAPANADRYVIRVRSGNTPAATDTYYLWAARATLASSGSGPQTYTVTRSVNGVVKAHAAGQDVRLAHPSYVAL
ncbi:hypothetical protein, partial [Streptomyces sp. 030-HV]|uniref:hypothetical protein n=1 Tax=Streptomyces sp. 030-HV TaxID=2789262 RepID=UPI00397EE3B8